MVRWREESEDAAEGGAAAWMLKSGVRFNVAACDLFGARVRLRGRLGVVKSWSPCGMDSYGVVFDDAPRKVYSENVCDGRWEVVEWEGDLEETSELRPMCPNCGHPLGCGMAAWTFCGACSHQEPGVSSTEMLSRLRTNDPNRTVVMQKRFRV